MIIGPIEIPARKIAPETKIRMLFENVGIPGFWTISTDIPPSSFDEGPPALNRYSFFLYDSQAEVKNTRPPTLSETLWAIGFMNCELAGAISAHPLRFMHEPFVAHNCSSSGRKALRRIVVRRNLTGYAVETVAAEDELVGTKLVYVL